MRVLLATISCILTALVIAGTANGSSNNVVYTSQYRMPGYDRFLGQVYNSYFGYYYYCYVNDNNDWDYCSPDPQTTKNARPLVNKPFSKEKGPCKDECTWSRPDDNYMCHSYWDEWVACDQKLYPYFKSYTYQADECFGMCDKHEGRHYYWCYNYQHAPKQCSPYKVDPQEQRIIEHMKKVPRTKSNSCLAQAHRKKRDASCSSNAQAGCSIETYIAVLAAIDIANSVYYYFQPNQQEGVYRYAYLQPVTPTSPVLPLVISARITNNTIRDPGTRESIPSNVQRNVDMMGSYRGRQDDNNDEYGHLIASENGGPSEVFNFVPQPRSLNRGIVTGVEMVRQSDWRRAEDSIHQWVRSGRGHVDQTVVVVYDTVNGVINPRPVGLAQRVIYYNTDGSVYFACEDYYSNDPMAEPTLNPVWDHCTNG